MSFSLFNKLKEKLIPSEPIISRPKPQDNFIESAAQDTIASEQLDANTKANNANIDLKISQNISSINKDITMVNKEYNNNLYSNILSQANNAHKINSNIIKYSNSPKEISNTIASNTAFIEGLKNSSDKLPKNLKDYLNNSLDMYSQSILSNGSIKNSQIHSSNTLNTISNSLVADMTSSIAKYDNSTSNDERKEIYKHITDKMNTLNELKPFLTTESQRNHLYGMEKQLTATAHELTTKREPLPDNSFSILKTQQGALTLQQSKASKQVIEDVLHGINPQNRFSQYSAYNTDIVNLMDTSYKTKQVLGELENSSFLQKDSQKLVDNGEYVGSIVGKQIDNYFKNGKADVVAYLLSPHIKDLKDQVIQSINDQSYDTKLNNYKNGLKSWMVQHNVNIKSFNPFTQEQINLINTTANTIDSDDQEQRKQNIDNVNAIFKISGGTHKTIYGSTYNSNITRVLRFLDTDSNSNLSNPQNALEITRSYSPDIQNTMKANTEIFKNNNSKNSNVVYYQDTSGNKHAIENNNGLQSYVINNKLGFNITNMSTLTGNDEYSLINSTVTQIELKMQKGQTLQSSITDIKNNNAQMLINHPILSGYTYGNANYSINPDVASDNGLDNVNKGDYPAILQNLNDYFYKKLISRHNVEYQGGINDFNSAMKDKENLVLGNKASIHDQIQSYNKSILGDKNDAHIYSSNGNIWINYNGHKFQVSSQDIKFAIQHTNKRKQKDERYIKESLAKVLDTTSLQDGIAYGI